MLNLALPKNREVEKVIRILSVKAGALCGVVYGIVAKIEGVLFAQNASAANATLDLAYSKQTLRIASTVMPDRSLDFNQTFQHIYAELDRFYKEQNPIFVNTIEVKQQCCGNTDELVSVGLSKSLERHVPERSTLNKTNTNTIVHQLSWTEKLKIAKTTLPDEQLDFNETFRCIYNELDAIYQEVNPLFTNTLEAKLEASSVDEVKTVSTAQVIEELSQKLEALAEEHGIEIHKAQLPAYVDNDVEGMEQGNPETVPQGQLQNVDLGCGEGISDRVEELSTMLNLSGKNKELRRTLSQNQISKQHQARTSSKARVPEMLPAGISKIDHPGDSTTNWHASVLKKRYMYSLGFSSVASCFQPKDREPVRSKANTYPLVT
jgi:hypothetical protein